MQRTKLISMISAGALMIAVAFGAFVYHNAKASALASSSLSVTVNQPADSGAYGRGVGGYSDENLANVLGITVTELTTAKLQAKEAVIAQAVEKGLITQAQADELKAEDSSRPLHKGGLLSSSVLADNGIDYDAELANALGITVEKLQEAYVQASLARIDQAVTDGTLTQEQADLMKGQKALFADGTFQASMQSAYEAAVTQAVKDSVITQAQADMILKNSDGLNFKGSHGLLGMELFKGGHGRGGMESKHLDDPAAETTTP
jgi:polyhydroxyalkanoate synthesis regulator phasin